MASETVSIKDLPDEVLMIIFSHFGAEELALIIAKVCIQWKMLAQDKIQWKKLSYHCDDTSDYSRIAEVRCTTLLGLVLISL